MTARPRQASPRPEPRLYLITQPVAETGALSSALDSAFAAGDVAAVLLCLAAFDERTQINIVKALAQPIQGRGVALLLDEHVDLVARGGADGVHMPGVAKVEEAIERLKPERIVGA